MYTYFIGLASNIDPAENVIKMLTALLALAPRIDASRILQTRPVDMIEGDHFLNLSVCLRTNLDPTALKEHFNDIETQLGRDRNDPLSKKKSRPADLDILFYLEGEETAVSPAQLPPEPFLRPQVIELLQFLDIDCPVPPEENTPPGIKLEIENLSIGLKPTTINRNH